MKKYEFYLGTISIVLCLLPIVLLRDTTIIHEHLTEISAALGTLLMGTGCLVFICEVDARCLSIKIRKSGIMLQKDFYTVPLICVILVVELVIYYLVDLTFVKERFEEFSGALGSIVVAYLVYGFFMENYQLMKTTEIEEPSKRKKGSTHHLSAVFCAFFLCLSRGAVALVFFGGVDIVGSIYQIMWNEMQKEELMREAIRLSLENMQKDAGGPFGAIIVKDGEIIGRGWNQVTSTNDPTAHGEVVAIRDACKQLGTFDLHDCEIYTSCEPCPMCYGAISRARIKKIRYANTEHDAAQIGFDDSAFHEDIKKEFTKRDIPVEQLLHEEALSVFKAWTEKTDKTPY